MIVGLHFVIVIATSLSVWFWKMFCHKPRLELQAVRHERVF